MEQRIDLAILSTGGTIKTLDHGWQPTSHGQRRCDKLIEMWMRGEIGHVAIVGGRRVMGIPSEAEVYRDYMCSKGCCRAIVIADASETCTNRDIPAVMGMINTHMNNLKVGLTAKTIRIGAVSYKEHLDRIEMFLRHLGFRNIVRIESGDEAGWGPALEWLFTTITRVDPEWQWLGLPLVMWANRRLNLGTRE